jgi:hypothetical protein
METSKNELKIFSLDFSNSIHEINIKLLCSVYKLIDDEVKDFEIYFNYYQNEDVLLILWDGHYLTKSYLNEKDLKIN